MTNYYRWEKDSQYYIAHLHQDILGNTVITRVWGKIGSKFGRIITTPYSTPDDAFSSMSDIKYKRLKCGYTLIPT